MRPTLNHTPLNIRCILWTLCAILVLFPNSSIISPLTMECQYYDFSLCRPSSLFLSVNISTLFPVYYIQAMSAWLRFSISEVNSQQNGQNTDPRNSYWVHKTCQTCQTSVNLVWWRLAELWERWRCPTSLVCWNSSHGLLLMFTGAPHWFIGEEQSIEQSGNNL